MKKALVGLSIGFCAIGIIATTISGFLIESIGAILFFGGLLSGVCGVSIGALAGHVENKENHISQKEYKDLEISEYKKTENLFSKDKNFEKHAKQTLNMDASKISDDNQLTR